jgi:hypothetical protein
LLRDVIYDEDRSPDPYRRHALLAEAVAAGMLAGERVVLHERTARLLAAAVDDVLAAEAASHWGAAGRAAEELPARLLAAGAAERVFGYAEAAAHWERAIELYQALSLVPPRCDDPSRVLPDGGRTGFTALWAAKPTP